MADGQKEGRGMGDGQRDALQRRSSKSRLSKQDEVEEHEEDNSPSSEASDATIVPTVGEVPAVFTPGGGSPESGSPDKDHGGGGDAASVSRVDSQQSIDSDAESPSQVANPKMKLLVRSQAVCDDASPPPEEQGGRSAGTSPTPSSSSGTTHMVPSITTTDATATLSPTPQRKGRHRLEKDGSYSSLSDNGNSPALSRDSSTELPYTDSTGTDLEEFIKMTLNKNSKDRQMLLKLEQEMTVFIKDTGDFHKFPQMSSYHRMLVHRVAAFFGLDHNIDQSGKCVVINRNNSTRIPDFKFTDHIRDDICSDEPKKLLLRRDDIKGGSFEESSNKYTGLDGKKSRSFEEREEIYYQTRSRIFNQQDSNSSQEGMSELSVRGVPQLSSSGTSSKEDIRLVVDKRPWSSTDSSGYSTDSSQRHKLNMTKASSFHGVTVLSRGDSRASSQSGHISKTDSVSSGVSSLNSPMTRPPPIPSSPPSEGQLSESGSSSHSAPSPLQLPTVIGDGTGVPFLPFPNEHGQPMVVWVASTVDVIPAGSMIINPQTGQPLQNSDGSWYRWNPSHGMRQVAPTSSQAAQPMPPMVVHPSPSAPIAPPVPPVIAPSPQQHLQQPQQQPQQQQLAPQPQQTSYIVHSQPQMLSQDQRQYSVESGGSDLSQQFSSTMTITPQSSTEAMSVPDPSNSQQPMAPMQAQPQPPQQVYMTPPASAPTVMQAQPTQQPQPHPQQTYVQQVPYYPQGQATGGQQMRYMYPQMPYGSQPPQPSQEVSQRGATSQPQNQQQNGTPCMGPHYVQNYAYPVVGFPQMTVQSVEYQQQPAGYPQPQAAPAPQPFPAQAQQGTVPASPLQQDGSAPQTNYTQLPQQPPASGMGQGSYMQPTVPGFYTSPGTNSSQVVTYQPAPVMPAGMAGQQGGGGYRPRTPPGQPQSAVATGQQACSSMGTVPASTPQYVSYTAYPQQLAAAASHPRPGLQPGPGTAGAVMAPFPNLTPQTPPGPGFSVVRPHAPNMQMGMHLQAASRTTPPPQGAQFMVPSGAQIKMVSMERAKPGEGYVSASQEQLPPKDMTITPNGSVTSAPSNMVPTPPKGMGTITAVRPAYRGPVPASLGEARLVGHPLHQMPRPHLQPLFQTVRARMPIPIPAGQIPVMAPPTSAVPVRALGACRSRSRPSKDSASPHSSTESTGSSESCGACSAVLEVTSLPPNLRYCDLDPLLDDLVKQGAKLHVEGGDGDAQNPGLPLASESTVLAVFSSESLAQRAFTAHKGPHYKLRFATKPYELPGPNSEHTS